MNKLTMMLTVLALAACSSTQETATTTPQPQPQAQPAQPAQAPAAEEAIDPVGTYEFTTTVEGQTVTGTFNITGTPGAYTGKILTNMFPEIPIVGATAYRGKMVVKGTMPDGELTINMAFTGPNFVGNWEAGGQTGDFTGKKLPK